MMLLALPPAALDQIRPYVEIRERFERRIDRDFAQVRPDDRSDLLSRYKIGIQAAVGKDWSLNAEYQYAHDLAWTAGGNFSVENSDLSVANAAGKVEGGSLTIGRQRLFVGSQRLISSSEWGNVPRSFDGVRFRTGKLDLWAVAVGVASPRPRDARIAGAGLKHRFGETLLIYKHDRVPAGDVDLLTVSHQFTRRVSGLTLEFEGAGQVGRNTGRDHRAWALHANLSRPLGKFNPFLELNAASGGSDPARSETFDNLYPSNHNRYGIMDMQSWRNMNELMVGLEWRPRSDVRALASFHAFGLRDPSDAWYSASGGPNRGRFGELRDPTGSSGRDTGREFDLETWWTINRATTFHTGLSIFDPGRFVRNLNGGVANRQAWGFASLQTRF